MISGINCSYIQQHVTYVKSNSMIFDNQYLKQVIGDWQCEVALEFGLQQTAAMVLDRLAAGYEPDKSLDALVDRIIEENTSQGCS